MRRSGWDCPKIYNKLVFFFLKLKRIPDVIFSEVTMYRRELGLLPAHDDVVRTERQHNRPVISSTSGERPVLGSSPVPLNKITLSKINVKFSES